MTSSRRMSEDERWPPGRADVLRCRCGAPALCREYERVAGEERDARLVCLLHSTGSTRISCDLPNALLARLERQAELLDTTRQFLIETALLGLVNEFEKIDRCPAAGPAA